MSFCVSTVMIIVIISHFSIDAAKLPSSFERCYLDTEESDECFRRNIEFAIASFTNGSTELGLATFEPLAIPVLNIGEGKGPVNVAQNFHDVKLHGLTGSKVLQAHFDLPNNLMLARSVTPNIRLEAEYEMKGRILLLPVFGNGPCNVTLINTKINHTVELEKFERKGKEYLKVSKFGITLRPERVTFEFANLFNGDARLGNEILKVVNENWNEVFTDIREGYEESLGLIFQGLANRVFSRVAIKDIFLN